MHTYSLFNILVIFELLGNFLIVFLSLPLFLFTLVMSMAPKRKSISAQNPLHSKASSSSNSAPLSLWFRDDDAHKAFSENFFQWGVHSEYQVILADFIDTDLPTVIHSREWESLCDVPVTCPLMLIQEFYSNMHVIDRSVPFFFTHVRGMRIPVTSPTLTCVISFLSLCTCFLLLVYNLLFLFHTKMPWWVLFKVFQKYRLSKSTCHKLSSCKVFQEIVLG